ncbi:MAG: hypothetical protein ACOY46_11980 [Bacillota bacterium]
MVTKLKERPSFDVFKDLLIKTVSGVTGKECSSSDRWLDLGDEAVRQGILYTFKKNIESEYGVELVLREGLFNSDIVIESMAIQLHHVFNNVYLMERINYKIRQRKN